MSYTVTQLITDAYCDSGIVSRQFETVQGYQLNDGLRWFNELLGDKAMDGGDIPYITVQYPFVGVVGQEQYFIPNCISVDVLVFYIGSVRYQMNYVDRNKYFGQPRANNINALPVSYTYERVFGGVMLWVYFWPQQPFLFTLTGNFFMQPVSLNQDLTSQVATANLGTTSLTNGGTVPFILNSGQLVINGKDLAGAYASLTAFISYINTGVIPCYIAASGAGSITPTVPYITAAITGNQFVLTNTGALAWGTQAFIQITTNGIPNGINLTFQNFSTINGPYTFTYFCTSYDQFFINYMEYSLAERLCQKFNFEVPVGTATQLDRYRLAITKLAQPLDLCMQKTSCLDDPRAISYAQANIGRGYGVSGF